MLSLKGTYALRVIAVGFAVCCAVFAQEPTRPTKPVTNAQLLAGLKDSSAWLMFGGDYSDQRHSPLTQITPQNVKDLSTQWMFQTDTPVPGRGFETTPLVIDGVMYVSGTNNSVWALDARTGRMIWRYRRTFPPVMRVCCGAVNRGLGVLGNRLYMGTLDAHLVALDRTTGAVVWDVVVEEPKNGFSLDAAPIVANGKVIIGISGGDYATRGFIDAYDAETGARAWRFYTIPAAGEPGSESWPNADVALWGGGAAWVTGSYDPALNLVYFGTGNPNPNFWGGDRKGDNLYTCSLVALDATTGKLKWHFQFTPHDVHDWDSTEVPILADVPIEGRVHKVVMLANRNGFFYTIDRETGKLLLAKPFTSNATNWAREIGADGRPVVVDDIGTEDKCLPDFRGGANFQPPSYDPDRHLFYVTARETCVIYTPKQPEKIVMGGLSPSGSVRHMEGREQYGALRAIDPRTGAVKWEHRYPGYPSNVTLDLTGGATSTASGVVFSGDNQGYLNAFNSITGDLLWRYQTGAPVWGAPPITYMLDGRQYVVIPSGVTIITFALPSSTVPATVTAKK
jgi:alcohol dehydrogenase (cytochrome c)